MLREIERMPYLFPGFDDSIDEEIVNKFTQYTTVLGKEGQIEGYTISSDRGLRSLLSNPAYMGYWVHKGVVVKSENHEAIIEYGPFIYAFNRLSLTNLDGTPNEELMEKRKPLVKKHFAERPAYLKNRIFSADPQYTIYTSSYPLMVRGTKGKEKRVETFYGFYLLRIWARFHAKYMITTRDVDNIFIGCLRQKLEMVDEPKLFLENEDKKLQEQKRLQEDIARDIKAAESSMIRIKEDIMSGRVKNPDLLEALDKQYTNLGVDLARLREIDKNITNSKGQVQQRQSYKRMMHEADEAWEEIILPEEMQMMIDFFVKKVMLEPLAPHFYKMTVHWYDSEWGVDEALCYRDGNASIQWTDEEDEILRSHYPVTPRKELMAMLPSRNIRSMATRAHKNNIRRAIREQEPDIPTTFCLQDWQIMQEHKLTEAQLNATKGGKAIKWF